MKSILKMVLALPLVSLVACTTMKVEKDHVKGVKRVAIVGFDVQQQRPVEGGDLFKALTHQDTSSKAEVKGRTEAAHVAAMYDLLRKKLETDNGWQVMPMDKVKQNKAYQEHFKAKTEGWQNRPIMNDRYNLLQAEGILDSFAIMTTEPEKRKQLQQDLGVDAILYVGIKVDLNNNSALASLVGQGKFSPLATTNLTLIDAAFDTKIWFDGSAQGEPAENNDKNFMGMADAEKLNQLAVKAAESSYKKLLANYKEKLAE
ncbi:hypothetical protein [Bdellovibrio sp. HCB337]|uniref:hypothetical protein n=1 Tax=Bdellovibrio sp. HCB337 TaxID=3394358 RepID=UPI0039A4D0AC